MPCYPKFRTHSFPKMEEGTRCECGAWVMPDPEKLELPIVKQMKAEDPEGYLKKVSFHEMALSFKGKDNTLLK